MANEIQISELVAGTGSGGLAREAIADLVLEKLYDPTDLSALMSRVPWQALGSGTLTVTQDAAPGAFAARTSEIVGGISNSDYATGSFSLSPAGYSRKYQITDLIPLTGGPVQLDRVAANLVKGVGLTLTDLLCALFDSLSNSVTPGSGVDLDVSTVYSAIYQLNSQSVGGPFACVLYPEQFNNFQSSLRSEAGAIQFVGATSEMLALRGPGFKGSWNGVDFYQSDSVGTTGGGADSAGAMFGAGCFAYTLGNAQQVAGQIPQALQFLANEAMVIEISRDTSTFMTSLIASIFPSVVEAEDARGVKIASDR